jgi:hypothetical protein
MPPLDDLLRRCKHRPGLEITHTAITGGKYTIAGSEDVELFYTLVGNAFEAGVPMYLTEKTEEHMYAYVDLDITQELDRERLTSDDLLEIVSVFVEETGRLVKLPSTFSIYVAHREPEQLQDGVKNGVHLMGPEVWQYKFVWALVREAVMPRIAHILQAAGCTKTIEAVYDKGIYRSTNIQVFGSQKPGKTPYLVTHIFDFADNGVTMRDTVEGFMPLREQPTFFGQRAPHPWDMLMCKPRKSFMNKFSELQNRAMHGPSTSNVVVLDTSTMPVLDNDEVRALVGMLSGARGHIYEKWMDVCYCLKNINAPFQLFDEFSQRTGMYDAREAAAKWRSVLPRANGFKIDKLHDWAQEDNPQQYIHVFGMRSTPSPQRFAEVDPSVTSSDLPVIKCHFTAAQYLLHLIGCDVVLNTGRVYVYNTATCVWSEDDKALLSKTRKLAAPFIEDFEVGKMSYIGNSSHWHGLRDALFSEADDKTEQFTNAANDLSVFAFKNGWLYDFKSHDFRRITRDDYLTTSQIVDYDFVPEAECAQEIADVGVFYTKVFPEEAARHAFLSRASKMLAGVSHLDKVMVIVTDKLTGDNGKTKTKNLLVNTFGKHRAFKPDNGQLLKNSNEPVHGANKIRWRGATLAVFDELCEDKEFDTTFIKQITSGGHSQDLRVAGGNEFVDVEFTATPMIFTNQGQLPKFSKSDANVAKRFEVFGMMAKFKIHGKLMGDVPAGYDSWDAYPYCHDADEHLDTKIKSWKMANFHVLRKRYHDLMEREGGKYDLPQSCHDYQRMLIEDSDQVFAVVQDFCEKHYEYDADLDVSFESRVLASDVFATIFSKVKTACRLATPQEVKDAIKTVLVSMGCLYKKDTDVLDRHGAKRRVKNVFFKASVRVT